MEITTKNFTPSLFCEQKDFLLSFYLYSLPKLLFFCLYIINKNYFKSFPWKYKGVIPIPEIPSSPIQINKNIFSSRLKNMHVQSFSYLSRSSWRIYRIKVRWKLWTIAKANKKGEHAEAGRVNYGYVFLIYLTELINPSPTRNPASKYV